MATLAELTARDSFERSGSLVVPALSLPGRLKTEFAELESAIFGNGWDPMQIDNDDIGGSRKKIEWATLNIGSETVQLSIKPQLGFGDSLRSIAVMDAAQFVLSDMGVNCVAPLAAVRLLHREVASVKSSSVELSFYQNNVRALSRLSVSDMRPIMRPLAVLGSRLEDSGIVQMDFRPRNIAIRRNAIGKPSPSVEDLFVFDLEAALVSPTIVDKFGLKRLFEGTSGYLFSPENRHLAESALYEINSMARGLLKMGLSEEVVFGEYLETFLDERERTEQPWKMSHRMFNRSDIKRIITPKLNESN